MKSVASLAAVLLAASVTLMGCEKNPSKLDNMSAEMPAQGATGAAAPAGSLEERVARLEKYADALEFLQKVYDQQKQQMEAQEQREPAPDALFAVDISQNVKLGMVEGPAVAPITIVEAWDFA